MAMEIVTRKDARTRGFVRYFTGKHCRNGHLAERLVSNGVCFECKSSRSRTYRAADPEKYRKRYLEWKRANPDKAKAATLAWRAKNPDKKPDPERLKRNKANWKLKNPEKARLAAHNENARRRRAKGRCTIEDINRIFKAQKGRCAYCRVHIGDNFHRDHIIAIVNGGNNWPSNIQLLCASCNCRKSARDPIEFAQSLGRLL